MYYPHYHLTYTPRKYFQKRYTKRKKLSKSTQHELLNIITYANYTITLADNNNDLESQLTSAVEVKNQIFGKVNKFKSFAG